MEHFFIFLFTNEYDIKIKNLHNELICGRSFKIWYKMITHEYIDYRKDESIIDMSNCNSSVVIIFITNVHLRSRRFKLEIDYCRKANKIVIPV